MKLATRLVLGTASVIFLCGMVVAEEAPANPSVANRSNSTEVKKAEVKKADESSSMTDKEKVRLEKIAAEYEARRQAGLLQREERLKTLQKKADKNEKDKALANNPPPVKISVSNELSDSEKAASAGN